MRVLMLSWEYPPHIAGGLGVAVAGLIGGLRKLEVESILAMPLLHGDEDEGAARILGCRVAPSADTQDALLAGGSAPSDAPYELLASPSASPVATYNDGPDVFDEVHAFEARAVTLVAGESFDLVHAHDWLTYPAGMAIAKATGRPLVAHLHSCEFDRSRVPDERIVAIEQAGLQAAAAIATVSHYTAGVVAERYGVPAQRLSVIHNGAWKIAASRSVQLRSPTASPTVLFVGRLTWQKGPLHFVEAAALIAKAVPTARFLVAGNGDLLPSVLERAARLGIADRVLFTGFVGRSEVERLYSISNVFVMCSESEPFGLVALEAAAFGVPVVLSTRCGAAEKLPAAPRVECSDVGAIAEAVLAILAEPEAARAQVEAGARAIDELSWENVASKVRDLYARSIE